MEKGKLEAKSKDLKIIKNGLKAVNVLGALANTTELYDEITEGTKEINSLGDIFSESGRKIMYKALAFTGVGGVVAGGAEKFEKIMKDIASVGEVYLASVSSSSGDLSKQYKELESMAEASASNAELEKKLELYATLRESTRQTLLAHKKNIKDSAVLEIFGWRIIPSHVGEDYTLQIIDNLLAALKDEPAIREGS